jgi:hypothetical protein
LAVGNRGYRCEACLRRLEIKTQSHRETATSEIPVSEGRLGSSCSDFSSPDLENEMTLRPRVTNQGHFPLSAVGNRDYRCEACLRRLEIKAQAHRETATSEIPVSEGDLAAVTATSSRPTLRMK